MTKDILAPQKDIIASFVCRRLALPALRRRAAVLLLFGCMVGVEPRMERPNVLVEGCNSRFLLEHPSNSLPSAFLTSKPKTIVASSPSQADASSTKTVQESSRQPLSCQQSIEALLWNEAGYNCSRSNGTSPTTLKRCDYIAWDDYFMAISALSALRSKDPSHATGACLVDGSNRVIGTGYNGFPSGCSDDVLPWHNGSIVNNEENGGSVRPWLHTKSPYEVHAEVNAILNKCASDCEGARLYTQYFPCNECAKVIIQSRIAEVVYVHMHRESNDVNGDDNIDDGTCHNGGPNKDSLCASRILLTMAGVTLRQFQPARRHLHLELWKALDERELKFAQEQDSSIASDEPCRDSALLGHRDLLLREANYDALHAVGSIKRTNYLSWDDYFMAMAFLTAQRSKDPNTQVGACIVDSNKRIVGLGYNGFPAGCSDDYLPWARDGNCELHKKYMYVCHAEVNAILNKGSADVRGSTIYVALFPCNECSKMIIQAGIREVVYMSDRYHDTESCKASRILFAMAGVVLRKHIPSFPSIAIQLDDNHGENDAEVDR